MSQQTAANDKAAKMASIKKQYEARMHNMYQNGTVKSQIEIMPSWQLAPYSQLPIRQLALSVERTGFNSST